MIGSFILGLDCGGTKTAAAVARITDASDHGVHFEIVGRGAAGPSNPCSVGDDQAYANVMTAIHNTFRNAGLPSQPVASISLCMAGIGRPEEMQRVRAWIASQSLATVITVTEDVEPVRWAALWESEQQARLASPLPPPTWERIVTLIAGTGSIACCTDIPGTTERVGGWGYLLGDEGSGFAIGLEALKSICTAYDQRLPLSDLQSELLDAMQCRTVPQLVPVVYRIPLPRSEIAALSRIVIGYAKSDSQARVIVEKAIEALALLVRLALQRNPSNQKPYLLAVTGGLLDSSSSILAGIQTSLNQHHCGPAMTHVVQSPVHGALSMAARALKNP